MTDYNRIPFSTRALGLSTAQATNLFTKNLDVIFDNVDVGGNLDVGGLIKVDGQSGTAGSILTSNGTSAPTWNTKVIVGAHLLTTYSSPDSVASVVKCESVDFDPLSTYNPATGVFSPPRDGYYNINVSARVTDFGSAPNSFRIQCAIQKKITGGIFITWAQTDTVDVENNYKAANGSINMILKLVLGDQIQTTVTMAGGGGNFAIRGTDFTGGIIFPTFISINSVD